MSGACKCVIFPQSNDRMVHRLTRCEPRAAPALDKPFATLQAKAALQGFTCTYTGLANIVMHRFGGGWIFDTVPEAEQWLAGQGAAK